MLVLGEFECRICSACADCSVTHSFHSFEKCLGRPARLARFVFQLNSKHKTIITMQRAACVWVCACLLNSPAIHPSYPQPIWEVVRHCHCYVPTSSSPPLLLPNRKKAHKKLFYRLHLHESCSLHITKLCKMSSKMAGGGEEEKGKQEAHIY